MDKVSVPIFVESRYKINRRRIKNTVEKTVDAQGVEGAVEVSVAIVGDRKMKALSKKYKGEDKTRNILSFSQIEGEDFKLKNDTLRLGDVVLSFPQVIKDAVKDEVLVDDKIDELIEHGVLHLLGVDHD